MGRNEHVHRAYCGPSQLQIRADLPVLLGGHIVIGDYFQWGEEFNEGESILLRFRAFGHSIDLGKWDAGKKLSSRGWHVVARLGEKVGNEWSRGGVCRGKRSGYCPGEQLFLD